MTSSRYISVEMQLKYRGNITKSFGYVLLAYTYTDVYIQ